MFRLQRVVSVTMLGIVFLLVSIPTFIPNAQEPAGTSIQLTGQVASIDGQTIIVDGLPIDISNTTVSITDIDIDTTVTVIGVLQQQTVIASTVIIVVPSSDEAPAPEATEEPAPEATAEATAEPDPESTAEPTPDDDLEPLIVIEGPVEAININVITVFNIDIQIDASDPILNELEIGDNIRVEGTMNFANSTIIVVAVNVTIIDIDVIIVQPGAVYVAAPNVPPGCKVTKKGNIKCSKKPKKSKKSKKS